MLPKVYKIMFWFSISLAIASLVLAFTLKLKPGVDFVGGSVLELQFEKAPAIDDVKNTFSSLGVSGLEVTSRGENGVLVRAHSLTEDKHQEVISGLNLAFPKAGLEEESFQAVEPAIGKELVQKSIIAITIVLLAVIIYIAIVFRKIGQTTSPWAMGLSAIVALFHDIIIPVGVFSILGHYYDVEVTAVFLAAALTILGYSVSDSVIIFDRVRENVVRNRGKENFGTIVHHSVLQTLTRSLNSTMSTLLALIAIFLFGGESIKYFSLALIIGIFLGAYSSIFVASPLLVWWTPHTKR